VASAVVAGCVSFVAGFFGPMLLSSSSLGPLLGVFVTGPVGLLVGALWGAVRWARHTAALEVGAVSRWIAAIWLISLLYTLFMVSLASQFALPGVGVQVAVLAASAFILYAPSIRGRPPTMLHNCGPIALAVMMIIVIMTLFPPVMRPWWGSGSSASAPLPLLAFILHPNFDASRHFPMFAVNTRVLALEWLAALLAGALTCYVIPRRTK